MPVLVVGLDSADRGLLFEWAREGELPALAGLMETGSTARLRSVAELLPESVWPTVFTGCGPGRNGHYNHRCVRPGTYSLVPSPGRTYKRPLWELVSERGGRALLLDVAYTDPVPSERVVQVAGWGLRGALKPRSWPPELLGSLQARHGAYARGLEEHYERSKRAERRHLRESIRMAGRRTQIALELMATNDWDLTVIDYWEPHNAGHVFHPYLDGPVATRGDRGFARALLDVYRAVDEGLGRLLEAAAPETDVIALSPYGLRRNRIGDRILPRVLTGLGYTVERPVPPLVRAAHLARSAFPNSIRRQVNERLPIDARMRLMERMWAEPVDWSRTRAVAEAEIGHGWIRINLRGREPQGTVDPGAEYEELCEEIGFELCSLTDGETGKPIVAAVERSSDLLGGEHVAELPDLLVRWREGPFVRSARHPRLGLIKGDVHDVPMTEHSGEGFAIAAGPRMRSGADLDGAEIADLGATLAYLLGCPVPEDMDGRVLTELIEPRALAVAPPTREAIDWFDERWGSGEAA
ncbi:MAG: alkaline phosphatase family protein [Solirubrobacterales bacterium]